MGSKLNVLFKETWHIKWKEVKNDINIVMPMTLAFDLRPITTFPKDQSLPTATEENQNKWRLLFINIFAFHQQQWIIHAFYTDFIWQKLENIKFCIV